MSFQIGLLSALLFAQTQINPQQVDESIRVLFRDIRVHVTDRDGSPVTGLRAEDFIVKESGDLQDVSFFEEVDLGNPISNSQDFQDGQEDPKSLFEDLQKSRNILMVLDTTNMRPQAFDEMKQTMMTFIQDYITDNDLVKLIQLDDQLIHHTSFVRSKDRLQRALEDAKYKGSMLNTMARQESRVVELYGNYLSPPMGGVLISDPRTGAITNEGLNTVRQERQYYLSELREAVRAKELTKANYYRMFNQTLGFFGTVFDQMVGDKAVYLFSGGGYVSKRGLEKATRSLATALGRSLTTSNVTVYSFVHVPKDPVGYAARALSPVSLETGNNLFPELGPLTRGAEGTILEEPTQMTTAPQSASDLTGGILVAAQSRSGIQEAFRSFAEASRHYYRLGYTIESPTKKSRVKVQFKNKQRGWKLHYGRQFQPTEPFIKMDEKDQLAAFSAALEYEQGIRNNLDAEWGFHAFRGSKRGEAIPIYFKLPTQQFPKNGYMIGFSALNDVRDLIDLCSAKINHPATSNGFLLYDVLVPRSKPYYLRGLVIDLDTGMKSNFEVTYDQPRFKKDQMSISSVILSKSPDLTMVPINHVRCSIPTKYQKSSHEATRCGKDPLSMGQSMAKPAVAEPFSNKEEMKLLFQVKNTTSPKEDCMFYANLEGEEGEWAPRLQITKIHQVDNNTVNYLASLKLEDIKPGNYKLAVTVTDLGTGDVSTHLSPIEIVN